MGKQQKTEGWGGKDSESCKEKHILSGLRKDENKSFKRGSASSQEGKKGRDPLSLSLPSLNHCCLLSFQIGALFQPHSLSLLCLFLRRGANPYI